MQRHHHCESDAVNDFLMPVQAIAFLFEKDEDEEKDGGGQ